MRKLLLIGVALLPVAATADVVNPSLYQNGVLSDGSVRAPFYTQPGPGTAGSSASNPLHATLDGGGGGGGGTPTTNNDTASSSGVPVHDAATGGPLARDTSVQGIGAKTDAAAAGTTASASGIALNKQQEIDLAGILAKVAAAGGQPVTQAPQTQTAIGTNVTTANTALILAIAGSCTHGGSLTNLSPAGTALLYVDVTGGTTGTTLGTGALPMQAPAASNATYRGDNLPIPPTTGAVVVYGPAGSVVRGFCS